MTRPLRIGTRGSQLALWQARTTADLIARTGGPPTEEVIIRTSGDRLADAPLSEAGGKRLFVKEIEDALLAGEIDLAVHSSKDMPVELPAGLGIGAVLPREDAHDGVILHGGTAVDSIGALLAALGPSPSVGTSSVRRIAQLSRLLPGARFQPIRGNLDTRLKKLDRGDHDAIVLAAAGVRRLGLVERISFLLPFEVCVPAPGQGAIAIEIRAGDALTAGAVSRIDDAQTAAALAAERAVVAELGGGCQTPIGAIALPHGSDLEIEAVVVSLDGARAVRVRDRGPIGRPAELGARVAARLAAAGAVEILAEAERSRGGE
jgi:hydroxymethylbilane synthase